MRWKFLQVTLTLHDIDNRLAGKLPEAKRDALIKAKAEFEKHKSELEAQIDDEIKAAKELTND